MRGLKHNAPDFLTQDASAVKPIEWMGSSSDDLRSFPRLARKEAGFELKKVQNGVFPKDWKSMPSIGSGAYEIRIHSDTEFRVIYVAKFADKIFVLHAFEKKSNKTSQKDCELARRRYKLMEQFRTKIVRKAYNE